MARPIPFKAGDTFLAQCTFRDNDDQPADLTGIVVASSVMSPDGLSRYPLNVIVLDQSLTPGRFDLRSDDTANWQIGTGFWDVQYTDADDVRSTETLSIAIERDITL